MSSKGREAFDSAAQIGVSSKYNGNQLSQVFYGIQVAIDDAAAEAGRDPINDSGNTGATPPTGYPDDDYPDLKEGDIWIDANGALNFYFNGQWNQARVYTKNVLPNDDSPLRTVPTIITPNGEEFLHQGEYNDWLYTRTDRKPIVTNDDSAPNLHPDYPAYPLREGDYWIDSNHHLYYWNNDSDAWIPVDAGGGRLPIFSPDEPTEHPDYNAPDNELQVGDTWYDSDNSFKHYIYDGSEWIALTPERYEAFTRIYEAVDPDSYNSGNDATCAIDGDGTIQGISRLRVSSTDLQNKIRFAYTQSQFLTIEDERNGAYAIYRISNINSTGDYDLLLISNNGVASIDLGQTYSFGKLNDVNVLISDDQPAIAVEGELWWDSSEDDLTLYVRYNDQWVPAAPPVSLEGIDTSIANIDAELLKLNANVAINKSETDESLLDLEEELTAFVRKTGDTITGGMTVAVQNNNNAVSFPNRDKANQVSTIRVDRPYSDNGGINADGSTNPNGRGGLNIDLGGASDQNRLRIRGGSSLSRDLLDITAVNNWKNIKVYSTIGLFGGDDKDTTQAIYAATGSAGHLCYSGISTGNQRLSWGSSKVWIRNANLDLTSNKIINVADPENPLDAVNLQTLQSFAGSQPDQGLFRETWWTFRAGADRSDCAKGEFCADSSDFFMSAKNEDNNSWGPSVSGGRTTQAFVTIYSSEGKLCHTYEVNKIYFYEKYTKKYITEFDWTWSHISNALVDGAKYKIVIPGFLT